MADNTDQKKIPSTGDRDKQEEIIKELAAKSFSATADMSPIHPGQEKLQKITGELRDAANKQQLQREQSLQSTLTQATTTLQDVRRVDTVSKLVAELQKQLANPALSADPNPFRQVITKLEGQIQQLLQDADDQAAQSLQQAVSALCQSQAAMFDSQSYSQIGQLLRECKNILDEQWPRAENLH